MQSSMVTSAFELLFFTITKNLGVVHGITVCSRSVMAPARNQSVVAPNSLP